MKKVNSIDNYNKPFPTTLRKLIERKGITQQAIADEIGVKRQTVSLYQDGSTQPTAETIVKIAELFNVTTDYLLTGQNRNVDENFNIACDYTGLSTKAIEKIVSWKNDDDPYLHFWVKNLSSLIEADEIKNFMTNLFQLLFYAKWESDSARRNDKKEGANFVDMEMARLWYLSKSLTNIVEKLVEEERLNGSYQDIIEELIKNDRLKGGVNNG